jgi:DNA-binding LacI/PurR family transcriptional regulator
MADLSSPARKYRRILDQLQQEILRGDYTLGEKLPSEADLIKRFGTSRITVGRAVNELRELGLVERRAGSGTYVCARPSAGALRTDQKEAAEAVQLFGLLIPDLGETEIFEPICRGMAEAPQADRYGLLWGHAPNILTGTREERAWQVCERFLERRVDGVFFAPFEQVKASAEINARLLAKLDESGTPVVLLDRDTLAYPRRTGHDLVGLDNRRAGYLATQHLLRLGRQRVAFVAPPDGAATADARIAGYREALFMEDAPMETALVRRLDPDDACAVRAMLDEWHPDAAVCSNDRTAGRLMHTLLGLGRRLPDDVALVGIDDAGYANLLPVPLTTVRQPCREIGGAAVGAMLERVVRPQAAPRDILLEGTLVVRASCGSGILPRI